MRLRHLAKDLDHVGALEFLDLAPGNRTAMIEIQVKPALAGRFGQQTGGSVQAPSQTLGQVVEGNGRSLLNAGIEA
jgi:hypothetical protein